MSEMDDIFDIEHFFKQKKAPKEVTEAFDRLMSAQGEQEKELLLYRKFIGGCNRIIKAAKLLEKPIKELEYTVIHTL